MADIPWSKEPVTKVFKPRTDVPNDEALYPNTNKYFNPQPLNETFDPTSPYEPNKGTVAVVKKAKFQDDPNQNDYVWYNDAMGDWKIGYLLNNTKKIVPLGKLEPDMVKQLLSEGWQ
jgi:hypothetical protein